MVGGESHPDRCWVGDVHGQRVGALGTCPARVRAASPSRSPISTLAPFPASVRTVCSPMPLAPPVTSAVLPSRRKGLGRAMRRPIIASRHSAAAWRLDGQEARAHVRAQEAQIPPVCCPNTAPKDVGATTVGRTRQTLREGASLAPHTHSESGRSAAPAACGDNADVAAGPRGVGKALQIDRSLCARQIVAWRSIGCHDCEMGVRVAFSGYSLNWRRPAAGSGSSAGAECRNGLPWPQSGAGWRDSM